LRISPFPQLNISVLDGLKEWVDARVAEGSYASTSDYVRDLMRRDRERREQLARLQAEIDKRRASGVDPRPAREVFAEIWIKNWLG
jgi:antitoxin ParD1/3/4